MSISTLTAALLLSSASVPVSTDSLPATVATVPAQTSQPVQAAETAPPAPAQQLAMEMPQSATPDEAREPGDQEAIVVTARHHDAGDPLEAVNIKSFEITQAVDRALVKPLAKTYQRILPDPVRSGFRNVLNNLREPVAFLNFLLQFKPGKAVETVARFAINSTVGVAGLFDIAKRKPFHLPRRINGFAYTMGYYGVKPGAYLYLPLIGPTTVRDVIGDTLDRLFLPVFVGKPFRRPLYGIAVGAFHSLDQRAEFDEKLEALHQDSDPYAATRADYLKHRQDIIDGLHNRHPKADVPVADAATSPASAPAASLPVAAAPEPTGGNTAPVAALM